MLSNNKRIRVTKRSGNEKQTRDPTERSFSGDEKQLEATNNVNHHSTLTAHHADHDGLLADAHRSIMAAGTPQEQAQLLSLALRGCSTSVLESIKTKSVQFGGWMAHAGKPVGWPTAPIAVLAGVFGCLTYAEYKVVARVSRHWKSACVDHNAGLVDVLRAWAQVTGFPGYRRPQITAEIASIAVSRRLPVASIWPRSDIHIECTPGHRWNEALLNIAAKLTHLTSLSLCSEFYATVHHVRLLASLANLRSLTISIGGWNAVETIQTIVSQWANLTSLCLADHATPQQLAWSHLGQLKDLKTLSLTSFSLDSVTAIGLCRSNGFASLTTLNLSLTLTIEQWQTAMSDLGSLPTLSDLTLEECRTSKDGEQLQLHRPQGFVSLVELHIRNTPVSSDFVEQIGTVATRATALSLYETLHTWTKLQVLVLDGIDVWNIQPLCNRSLRDLTLCRVFDEPEDDLALNNCCLSDAVTTLTLYSGKQLTNIVPRLPQLFPAVQLIIFHDDGDGGDHPVFNGNAGKPPPFPATALPALREVDLWGCTEELASRLKVFFERPGVDLVLPE